MKIYEVKLSNGYSSHFFTNKTSADLFILQKEIPCKIREIVISSESELCCIMQEMADEITECYKQVNEICIG